MNLWSLLLWASLGAAPAGDARVRPVVVREPAALAAALAGKGVVDCRLTLRQLEREQQRALREWVAAGGTLLAETDVAQLFGFETAPVQDRERIGRARRAAAYGASGLLAQVEGVFYRFGAYGSLITAHATATGVLEVADPVVQRRVRPTVVAELWYGDGRYIHRPFDVHEARLDGQRFLANVETFAPRRDDEVRVPLDQLFVAERNAREAHELAGRDEAKAAEKARAVKTAFTLWLAEHLTAGDKLDEALPYLHAVAAAEPEDPAVYLAVYRWNLKKGRVLPAEEALQKATEGFKKLGLGVPGPDVRQLRVAGPTFAVGLAQATAAAATPTKEACAPLAARLAFLLGQDVYRTGNLNGAAELWLHSTRLAPQWPVAAYHLGLLWASRAEQTAQPNRERIAQLRQAGELFLKASLATQSDEFPAAARMAAEAWAKASGERALELVAEPLDVTLTDHFILRYDGQDRRFQVGPTLNQLTAAWERAYGAVASLGIWLDPVEVLLYPDSLTMLDALPATGVTPQAAEMVASVGRTIFSYPAIADLAPFARHELTHVAVFSLTEDGLAPPLWLAEGLATGMEQNPAKAATARQQMSRGNAITIDQINNPRFLYDRRVTDQAHGQAQYMTEALAERFGLANVVLYLQQVGWGVAPETAFGRWTDLTFEQFLLALMQGRL